MSVIYLQFKSEFEARPGAKVHLSDIARVSPSDDEIAAEIKEAVNDVNRTLPSFKHMTAVEVMKDEFEKTTSKKIKCYLYK